MSADLSYEDVLTKANYCANLIQYATDDTVFDALLAIRDAALAVVVEIAAVAEIDLKAAHLSESDHALARVRLATADRIVEAMAKAAERYEV